MREHKGLSFGVRRVCRPYYGGELTGEESGLNLSFLAPRNLLDAQGVVVEELIDGVNKEATKRLRYPVPDVSDNDVASHLSLDALDMLAQNLNWSADYDDLSEEEQTRCDVLVAAYLTKCEASGHLRGTETEAARHKRGSRGGRARCG